MSNRDTEQVILSVQRATMLMDPFFKIAAVGTVMMITFLARMVKEKKVKKSDFKNFQEFLKATDGKYSIANIPVTKAGETSLMVLDGKTITTDLDIKQQLDKLGIQYTIMPDLDQDDGFLQVAISGTDVEQFTGWYERYLASNMKGGEKRLQDLQNLTSGKTSIISIPVEGKEEMLANDFEALGINFAIFPDLNVGDGEIQLLVANADMPKAEHWYQLYKEDQLSCGNEVKDMKSVSGDELSYENKVKDLKSVSMKEYLNTGNLTEEAYIHTASPDLVQANEKYEGKEPGDIEASLLAKEQQIKDIGDAAFEQYEQNPDYLKITINHETLVNKSMYGGSEIMADAGLFASRIPSTYGKNELDLVLPAEQVFRTDDGLTYIAFMEKDRKPLVMQYEGQPVPVAERETGSDLYDRYYDEVNRGFREKEQLATQVDLTKGLARKIPEKIPSIPVKMK